MNPLKLPYPPSANRYWRRAGNHIHKSTEARQYQAAAAMTARLAGIPKLAGDVSVTLNVHRPARRGDLDNSIKVVLDAIKGIAFEDDKQVSEIHAYRHEAPKTDGWVTIQVEATK